MDADLQDPPEIVPEMLKRWREGHAVVYGIRRNRQESLAKRAGYDLFYRLLRRLSDIEIPADSGDFGLIDRRVVDAINALPERNRFVRGLRAWYGGRQCGVVYDRAPRAAGRTKYSLGRLVRLALDGLFSFSVFPMRLIFGLGVLSSLLAGAGLVFFVIHRVVGFRIFGYAPADVPGFTSLILSVLMLSGAQLLALGLIGEYLGRIYVEVKKRPPYLPERIRPSRYRAGPES
jgi:dolichol-phosphate mannosyltransferase